MKVSIYALEKLIKEYESNIANASKQLKDLDAGKITLSPLKIASVENTLEFSTAEYEKYKAIYDAIPQKEKEDFRELKDVQEMLAKQSYYKLQKIRIKRNLNLKRNQKLEAMMVLDEVPIEVKFDDAQLLEVANVIIKYNARESVELVAELGVIREEFDKRLDGLKDKEDLKHFHFLDTYIPIILLHFSILVKDIEETITLYNEKALETKGQVDEVALVNFVGFPKYEDWWFEELLKNHEAYFALYFWKYKIDEYCLTEQQKIIWDKLFTNWLMIKKILTSKDENAYAYNFIFDDMLQKYGKIDEEFEGEILQKNNEDLLKSMDDTDIFKHIAEHEIATVYSKWKKDNTK